MKLKFTKRLAAAGLALAMSLGLMATSAFAADTFVSATPIVPEGGVDGDGQITVTVYDQEPGATGTGAHQDVNSTPVKDVGIKALLIGSVVELTTTDASGAASTQVAFGMDNSDLIDLLGLDTNNAIAFDVTTSTYYFAPTVVQTAASSSARISSIETYLNNSDNGALSDTTNENGVATFMTLEYGVYLLAKSALPANATTDLVPFLVAVPMYVEDGSGSGSWNSSVFAYPKVRTATITLTKAASDPGVDGYVNSGDTIPYTITTTIPASGSGQGSATPFSSFVITDTNAGGKLTFVDNTITVTLSSASPTLLTRGTDYTVTYSPEAVENILAIELTEAGRAKLNNHLTLQQTLTVTYNATVNTASDFSRDLTNTAYATYQRSGMASPTSTDSSAVTLYTYALDLTKTLSDNGVISTADNNRITFALYSDSSCTVPVPVQEVTGNGYWVAPADPSASATVTHMIVSPVSGLDNKSGTLKLYGLEPRTYYLKETATMTGYSLLNEPITIVIAPSSETANSEKATATVNDGTATIENGVISLQVENTKLTAGFTLPQTGGTGTLAATAVGLGLLCVGIVLLVVYRRKGSQNS